MLKQLQFFLLLLFLAALVPDKAFAQFPYNESFMNSTAPGMNLGGTAVLTSGNGSDAVGNGYLRLTTATGNQAGYAYSSSSFPSSKGISVNFEYYTYGGNGADGISFFLYDAATSTFNVGSYGGGLGYTNVSSAGLSNGYLGIGLDEYGNYSDPSAGGNGGPGRAANSVTIRGAYNDTQGAYYYLTTTPVQTNYGFSIGSSSSTRPTSGGSGYRKAYIDIIPHSGGVGYDIMVKIQHDGNSTPVTVINNYYYSKAAPANLKFGYAASTGGSTNYHEIRNVSVNLPAGAAVVAPTQSNESITTCSNGTGSVNVSSGFSTTNSPNGAINTASVDLDPATSGIQTTYTVASKGTFTSDGSGNITFTPLNSSVMGTASCSFTVADNYGATSNTATVTATINAAPTLTITNPAAVCAPATVNLTASAVTAGSDAGLTLTYYTDAAATATLSNPSTVANSGTYYIKAVNANNCSVIMPVTVTINPQPTTANAGVNQNITAATPTTATLNGNSATVGTGSWSQISGPNTATFANPALRNTGVSNLNPGAYVFRWTITNGCGSSVDDVTINITGTQSITFAALPAKAYADADFNAGATASSGLPVAYASSNTAVATVDAAGLIHILSVGNTNITASQPGNSNYTAATPVVRTLTVNKASQTITFAALPVKAYGDADFNAGATASSGLAVTYASSNPAVATIDAAGLIHILSAGTTNITASQSGNGSYNAATSVIQIVTVNKASQTITFNALAAKTYGDADFTLSGNSSSGLPVSYSSSDPTIATVTGNTVHILKAGTVTITAVQSGNSNYNAATSVQQTLTINPAALTITAGNQTKTYNTANPVLTVSYSGFVNGDTPSGLTAQPTASTTATAASSVGTYPITVTGAANNNYTITYVNGSLSVVQSTPTVTFNALPAKTYGDADFSLSATASSGLPITYTSSNPLVATVDAAGLVHILSAGNTVITASQAGNGNYSPASVQQTLTVNKASLTITANNQSKTYAAANPVFTASYSGFVNGDTNASLTAQPVITTAANAASAVGTYPITVSGAASNNYTISYVNGSLSVFPGAQTITFALQSKTYGDPDFALNATASSGLPVTYSSSNPAVATVDAQGTVHIVSAGNVTISALQQGNGNYIATTIVNQQLTITKATLTITADTLRKAYGAANPLLTVSYSGFVNGDTNASLTTQPVTNTAATAASAVGTYPVTVSGASSSNYLITYQPGTLTVGKGAQTLSFAALPAKVYGDADFSLSATSSGGLPVVYTSSDPNVATVDASGNVHILSAGTTNITASQAGDNNHLAATDVTQILSVNKASLTVTAVNQTRAGGAANPALTVNYSGFVNGDLPSGLTAQPVASTTATSNSAPGTYPITVSGAASLNYTFNYLGGTLTVTNATVSSVSLVQVSLFENRPSGTLAGTLSATSVDPNATYTYSLVSGTGSTDNALFSIQGNKLLTAKSLDYEQKASYSITVRATNQYGLYLDQTFSINLNDVNEAPTLAAIANQSVCNTASTQTINLTGITAGPETAQTTAVTVSSNNAALFNYLYVSSVTNGSATITYQLATTGTATVNVTVKDNGGTANGGVDSVNQTFTLTANAIPVAAITSDKGLQISKGEVITLTAGGNGTYNWGITPNIGGTQSSATIKVRPSQTTTYQVTVTNASGCSSTASITVQVNDDYALIQPANILTPNGDGKNDTWVVKNLDLYPNNTVSIFDKGGRLLNKVSHYNNDWNGTLNGSPLAEGTYYYVIDFGPGKELIKGFITILRNR